MPSVLFVCTGNLYRSPTAAAFFSKKLQAAGRAQDWVIESAGTWTAAGQGIPRKVLRVASSLGIDLSQHITRQVDRVLLEQSDLVVVMEKGHKEALGIEFPVVQNKLQLLSEMGDQLAYDIPDPLQSSQEFAVIAGQISGLIERGFDRMCQLAGQVCE